MRYAVWPLLCALSGTQSFAGTSPPALPNILFFSSSFCPTPADYRALSQHLYMNMLGTCIAEAIPNENTRNHPDVLAPWKDKIAPTLHPECQCKDWILATLAEEQLFDDLRREQTDLFLSQQKKDATNIEAERLNASIQYEAEQERAEAEQKAAQGQAAAKRKIERERALVQWRAERQRAKGSKAQAIEIKGITLGMTEADIDKYVGAMPLSDFTIAGVSSKYDEPTLKFHHGKLDTFYFFFDAESFDLILEALHDKYPKLKCKNSTVHNGMGTAFTQTECKLRDAMGTMELSRYIKDIDTSILSLTSDASVNRTMKERDSKKSDL